MLRSLKYLALMGLLAGLVACAGEDSTERVPADAPGYVNGKPVHPTVKIGKPYRVGREEYRPKYEPTYKEEGVASWYGPDFQGKSTANGERYNQWAMTAAHRTLPMPSMVKVTNLSNGKSIMVRVNDRGPFSDSRIIDLSRAAAEELDMVRSGTAKVRVEYEKPETEKYIAKLKLDKPAEWTQTDVEMAQKETIEDQEEKEGKLPAPVSVLASDLKPPPMPHHPIEHADDVPQHYAFNAPFRPESTIEKRGVKLEEVGYAEDAFSVIDAQAAPSPAPFAPTGPPPFGRVNDPPAIARVEESSQSHSVTKVSYTGDKASVSPQTAPEKTVVSFAPKHVAATGPRYFVQAGSFGNRDNAYALADKLAKLAKVDVREWPAGDKVLYRVRLGPIAQEEAAMELISRLENYGINDAKKVREQ